MILKEYQRDAVKVMSRFFKSLSEQNKQFEKLGTHKIDSVEMVWNRLLPEQKNYQKKFTGHGYPCPNFCLQIPTGGGKTLLAGHAIHQYIEKLAKKSSGLVLWVVPSKQIYSQTWSILTDRSHPLRRLLDSISGQRIKILNKKSRFSPDDIDNNLSIFLLMLQSFSRKETKKEKYKIFQDNSKFVEFFPSIFNRDANDKLIKEFPNLDHCQGVLSTSLANTIKILRPLVVLDEGHKAKSELASSAIAECNPVAVVELTATPTEQANVLFSVAGRRLAEEEMIKLDLNAYKISGSWKAVLDAGVAKLSELDSEAEKQQKKTGQYIRPICVIQAQYTGKDQRQPGKIHAEDVREYLVSRGVSAPDAIRIKTSTTNEIENEDLLSSQSPVRFIITKSALQEGWDCPFAYVLVALAPSKSRRSLTQLIGRVLRQPRGRKTGNRLLDESYIFVPEDYNVDLLDTIREGFEYDGLGDIIDRVHLDGKSESLGELKKQKKRNKFKNSLSEFKLPAFIVNENGKPRLLKFKQDILPWIDFSQVSLDKLDKVKLPPPHRYSQSISVGYYSSDKEERDFLEKKARERLPSMNGGASVGFLVRNLIDIIPNAWQACEIVNQALNKLRKQNTEDEIEKNPHSVLDEIRYVLEATGTEAGEINRLARNVFEMRKNKKEIQFILFFAARSVLKPHSYFTKDPILGYFQKSLFEPITTESLNELEKMAANTFEEADMTHWWFRNQVKHHFYLAGWRRQKFYPDFIVTATENDSSSFDKIVVIETKGNHLMGDEDSAYKQELVELFNNTIIDSDNDLGLKFKEHQKDLNFLFLDSANLSSQIHHELSNKPSSG